MSTVGLLHTVPALAATFDTLLTEQLPDAEFVHIADARLLRTAIREGVTDAVRASVAGHLAQLVDSGADAILVTCSSIGEAAEEAGARLAVPVVRVDAAMARDAVARATAAGGSTAHIAVLATNTATIGPTTRLVQREIDRARAAGDAAEVTVDSTVVDGAAAARAAGRPEEHDRLVAEAVAAAAEDADVIVLAQASMADAAALAAVSIPVLTSPTGGVASLVAALDGSTSEPGTADR